MNGREHIKATRRCLDIRYAIRDVVLEADKVTKQGHKVLKLNIGDPLAYDFQTPEHIIQAASKAMNDRKNGYTPSKGIPELREEIVRAEKKNGVTMDAEDIIVTTGVTEALMMIFGACLEPGDEILVPGPTYPPYITYSKFYGGAPVSYRTMEERGWDPDIEDIKNKISPRTKCLAIINPNNPTGGLYPEETLRKILKVVEEHNETQPNKIFVISDEIYNKMVFDGKTAVATASLNRNVPVIILNGISKIYLAPGWRLGYLAFRDHDGLLSQVRTGIENLGRSRLCASSVAQYGYLEALRQEPNFLTDVMKTLKERRDFCYEKINATPGLSTSLPEGAFYMFPRIHVTDDDYAFVIDVLKKIHVLFVHGSGFCKQYGKGHFRLVFLPQMEVLEPAFGKLEKYMKEKYG